VLRPAPTHASLAHPSQREREATLKSFRYALRERQRELLAQGLPADHRGPRAWVGVAGDAQRCPVAAWLRLDRAYARVLVCAGDMSDWPHGRHATFHAYAPGPRHSIGRALGVGYCDAGLTAAIAWLDGACEAAGRILTVGDCLAALDAMEQAWPETTARAPQGWRVSEHVSEQEARI
jgi:hypothetical protein